MPPHWQAALPIALFFSLRKGAAAAVATPVLVPRLTIILAGLRGPLAASNRHQET